MPFYFHPHPYPCHTHPPPSPFHRRTCPLNQVTSSDATQYPTSASFYVMTASGYGGFTSSRACVNQPGFGLNARVSSKCDLGFYNEGDTSGPCKACPVGLTTAGEGASERSQCGVAAGFGFAAGSIKPCPIGECQGYCDNGLAKRPVWRGIQRSVDVGYKQSANEQAAAGAVQPCG
jgi:hypothetical protein